MILLQTPGFVLAKNSQIEKNVQHAMMMFGFSSIKLYGFSVQRQRELTYLPGTNISTQCHHRIVRTHTQTLRAVTYISNLFKFSITHSMLLLPSVSQLHTHPLTPLAASAPYPPTLPPLPNTSHPDYKFAARLMHCPLKRVPVGICRHRCCSLYNLMQ